MMSLLSNTTRLKKRFPTWLLPAFGYAVSAASLIWVLRDTRLRDSVDHFRHLNWLWVALALLFEVAANFSHAWRWRIILSPAEDVPFWRSVQSVLIGLFANEVLPAKAGEADLQEGDEKIDQSDAALPRLANRFLLAHA